MVLVMGGLLVRTADWKECVNESESRVKLVKHDRLVFFGLEYSHCLVCLMYE